MEIKKTPLYQKHIEHGGKMVEFAGYMLPVQYSGIITEHNAVRNSCGIFDVSHMGEIKISGSGAQDFLQYLLPNDISAMKPGNIKYSPMCNVNGGIVDDLLVYKYAEDLYILVVNASNKDKDYEHITSMAKGEVDIQNISESITQIALQGPLSESVMLKIVKSVPKKYYSFIETEILGTTCTLSRTGYTGEDGFEVYCPNSLAQKLWDELINAGEGAVAPCGLGARDTLRFESCMPLYGHEMNDDTTPLEAGLGRFIKLEKEHDFIGRQQLSKQQLEGVRRKLCGIEVISRGIARDGAVVYYDGKPVGRVTSGTMSPTINKALAMAMVEIPYNAAGTYLSVEVRGKMLEAKVVEMPFYKRK